MKFLAEKLATCNASDALWFSETAGSITATQLTNALVQLPSSDWLGKRVALGFLPVIEFVSTLIFLDGLADAILLLPSEDDAATRTSRLEQAQIDVVIENDGLGFIKLFNALTSNPPFDRPAPVASTWLLPTSGTTGTPKLITHTLASLTRSMAQRQVGDTYIWGSLYSLRRFAGLQVFLQAWMCATPLLLNEEGAELSAVLSGLTEQGCNALSATPSMWRKLAMHPLFDKLALKQITLGGEIVDQAVLDMLTKRFPDARITHIYASTEAGVGFAVRDGKAGFPKNYLSKPPSGIAMRVDEHDHLWFGPVSEHTPPLPGQNTWMDSGDVVAIDANRVNFLGRANGSINVGGNKVMPEEVEAVIKELPEVAFVQVRARKSAMLGNLVEAAVTPRVDAVFDAAFKKKVTAHCRNRLDGFKVPAFIVLADSIQLTASGKLSRVSVE
jgi:acyl-CoA synthetase (AMP-forming)/AMP-acid ligase II